MNPLYNTVVYAMWFLSTYFVVLLSLMLITHRNELQKGRPSLGRAPQVSVIVPAYNEGEVIAHTIRSLKDLTYPAAEFIIVNDGSTDSTSVAVRAAIAGDRRFTFIDRKENWGKARSLNQGIAIAKGEFVATMDSDSVVEPVVFEKALPFFAEEKVASVTISVEVSEPRTLLQKIVEIEYIIGLSLFLKILSFFDSVNVTPGPFSLYRKSVLDELGGFDPENITEDLEIAYRMQKAGYRIENCYQAKVSTLTPVTFNDLYIQRKRWYTGAVQTLIKHRDVMLHPERGVFGIFVPFTFLLIAGGLMVFAFSLYLLVKRFVEGMWHLHYTGFNLLEQMLAFEFDVLSLGRATLVGLCAFLMGIFLMLLGLRIAGKRYAERRVGMIGFPFLFFLYQLFWGSAFLAVLRRRDVKWR